MRNSAGGVPGELDVIGDRKVVLEFLKRKINRHHRRSRGCSLEAEGAVAVRAHLRGHGEESFDFNLAALEGGPGAPERARRRIVQLQSGGAGEGFRGAVGL